MTTVPVEVLSLLFVSTHLSLQFITTPCHMLYTTGHAGPREVAATYQTQDVFKSIKDGVFVKQHWSRQICCISFTLLSPPTHPPSNGGCSRSYTTTTWGASMFGTFHYLMRTLFPWSASCITLFSVPSCAWVWLVLRVTLELQIQHNSEYLLVINQRWFIMYLYYEWSLVQPIRL